MKNRTVVEDMVVECYGLEYIVYLTSISINQ